MTHSLGSTSWTYVSNGTLTTPVSVPATGAPALVCCEYSNTRMVEGGVELDE